MQRTKRTGAVLALLAGGLAAAGCAEKLGEGIAERAIEEACEDEGTECNIDIDGDSVEFQTEDGSMTVDEDGNAVIVGSDGSVVEVNADGDGDVTMTDGNGSVVMEQDGETMRITGDEGDATISSGGDVPAQFPAAIALPDGAVVVGSAVFGDPSTPGGLVTLNLTVPGTTADVAAVAAAGISSAGYTQASATELPDAHLYSFEGDGQTVTLTVTADAASGGQLVSYSVGAEG
jgi:hypothetical protein